MIYPETVEDMFSDDALPLFCLCSACEEPEPGAGLWEWTLAHASFTPALLPDEDRDEYSAYATA